jgi:hypothetical protein
MTDVPAQEGEGGMSELREALLKPHSAWCSCLMAACDCGHDAAALAASTVDASEGGDRPHPINEHEANCPDCMRVIEAEQRDYDAASREGGRDDAPPPLDRETQCAALDLCELAKGHGGDHQVSVGRAAASREGDRDDALDVDR